MNRRSNLILEHNGEKLSLKEWSERIGIERRTIKMRLKLGWTIEKALTTPLDWDRNLEKYKMTPEDCEEIILP
jgi:hypothetical protein